MDERMLDGTGEAFHSSDEKDRRCTNRLTFRATVCATVILGLFVWWWPLPAISNDDLFLSHEFVTYKNESISLAFNNVRAGDAAFLMLSKTGVAITLPTSTHNKTVNLTLQNAKMDEAVHTLLASLELKNSFFVYDLAGRLTTVVALEKNISLTPPETLSPKEEENVVKFEELSAPEKEALVRDFRLWSKLSAEDRESIHARLRTIPPSRDRDQLIDEYVRLVLGVSPGKPENTQ